MQLQIFKFEEEENHFNSLTTIEIDNEIWFVASEVCKLLEIKNASDAVSRLDDDEKLLSVIPIAGQNRSVNLVSESGLYALAFKSQKESAKRFRKWVTKEVIPAIRKTGSFGIDRTKTANFVTRFNENYDRIDKGYFSVIGELFIRLYGQFERAGYLIPNKAFGGKEIRPDVSVGKLFSTYLQNKHPKWASHYKMYSHLFNDGSEFEARQYKNELLPIFIQFIDEKWLPENSINYFKERDPVALEYLPKLLKAS